LLRKGRGLRKQRRGEPEAPPPGTIAQENEADDADGLPAADAVTESPDSGGPTDASTAADAAEAAPSNAIADSREPEIVADPGPETGDTAAAPEETGPPQAPPTGAVVEVVEIVEAVEVVEIEAAETEAAAADMEAALDRVEALVSQTTDAGEPPATPAEDAEVADDDEPPLESPRADPPPGPVLETRTLPEPPVGGVRPMELPRVVAIANQKGGVGKTTTTVNLGAALAEIGFRVLVLDLDPQGNASTGLGLNPRDVEGSVYDVLLADAALDDIIEPTSLKNLFVAPATIDLAGAEIELVPVMSRELRLRKAVEEVKDDYDVVLIDCPPSLGLLTVNGLAASDDVIVPIQCEYYALEGLGQLLRNVGLVQANLNPGLDVRGIVLTMYDARTKLADQVVSEVRAYFGEKVYETVVPRTVRLSEAPSFGQPIIVFDPTSRGAKAYRDLAKEVSRGASRRSG